MPVRPLFSRIIPFDERRDENTTRWGLFEDFCNERIAYYIRTNVHIRASIIIGAYANKDYNVPLLFSSPYVQELTSQCKETRWTKVFSKPFKLYEHVFRIVVALQSE